MPAERPSIVKILISLPVFAMPVTKLQFHQYNTSYIHQHIAKNNMLLLLFNHLSRFLETTKKNKTMVHMAENGRMEPNSVKICFFAIRQNAKVSFFVNHPLLHLIGTAKIVESTAGIFDYRTIYGYCICKRTGDTRLIFS